MTGGTSSWRIWEVLPMARACRVRIAGLHPPAASSLCFLARVPEETFLKRCWRGVEGQELLPHRSSRAVTKFG
jgi:hypothetical protein